MFHVPANIAITAASSQAPDKLGNVNRYHLFALYVE
jgi:hypothetical protein